MPNPFSLMDAIAKSTIEACRSVAEDNVSVSVEWKERKRVSRNASVRTIAKAGLGYQT